MLPPDKVVIEILETVPPDQEVVSVCHKLQQQGYPLALHNSLDDERTEAFAPFVDILKVDFQQTSPAVQEKIVRRYQKLKLRVVAEKVETEAEFRRASQLGCDYFQGYFFASPTVLQSARVPASQMNGLRLMTLIQKEELDSWRHRGSDGHDLCSSHSLLAYLNSANFHWADRIESVRQGLLLLGSDEVRKWVSMASMASLGQNRPPVLMAQVLMRGRFCETIANSAKLSVGNSDPFLVGMFSLLDAILQRPLQWILDELNVGRNIRNALLNSGGEADHPIALILRIVKSYELANFQEVDAAARAIGLSPEALSTCYLQSLAWVETVFTPDEQTWRAGHLSTPIGFHRNREARAVTARSGQSRFSRIHPGLSLPFSISCIVDSAMSKRWGNLRYQIALILLLAIVPLAPSLPSIWRWTTARKDATHARADSRATVRSWSPAGPF